MSSQFYPKHEGPWAWISLLFSTFYFLSFFYMPFSVGFVIQSLLFYSIFIALYVLLLKCGREWRLILVLAMVALGFFVSSINPSASMFLGYASFFASYYFSRKLSLLLGAFIVCTLFCAAWVFNLMVAYYILPGLIPIVVLLILGSYIQREEFHKWREKKDDDEKKQLVQTAERERIARDLHDTLGHTLSSIALKSQLAKKLGQSGDVESALKEIAEVETISREALSEVRAVISNYKALDLTGNISKLRARLEDGGFSVSIELPQINLKPDVEAAAILILKEAVTNILRHSNGSQVLIHLDVDKENLKLLVRDDGKIDTIKKGNGINGIRERIDELKGKLNINLEDGVSILCEIPRAI